MSEVEKPTASKLKLVASDDESSDNDSGGENDLGLSLEKLNLGPQKKLLILCLGGLLVNRVHLKDKATVRGLRPDLVYGKFLGNQSPSPPILFCFCFCLFLSSHFLTVFKRPFCTDFLKFCFERFEVALWSSARELANNTYPSFIHIFDLVEVLYVNIYIYM